MHYKEQQNEAEIMDGISFLLKFWSYYDTPRQNSFKRSHHTHTFSTLILFLTQRVWMICQGH
jgi:cytochrome c oxidase assembly factor CtaG